MTSILEMRSCSSADMFPVSRSGWWLEILSYTSTTVHPGKGRRPVTRQNSVTPSDQMSADRPEKQALKCQY